MLKIQRYFFLALVVAFVVWGLFAAFDLAGQRKLFYEQGGEELYDFWMPRMCLEQGYVGHHEQYEGFVDVLDRKPNEVSSGDVLLSDWCIDSLALSTSARPPRPQRQSGDRHPLPPRTNAP